MSASGGPHDDNAKTNHWTPIGLGLCTPGVAPLKVKALATLNTNSACKEVVVCVGGGGGAGFEVQQDLCRPPLPGPREGGVRSQRQLCLPEIILQFPVPFLHLIFLSEEKFSAVSGLVGWGLAGAK